MEQTKIAVKAKFLSWTVLGAVGVIGLSGCGGGSQVTSEQSKLPLTTGAGASPDYQKARTTSGSPAARGYPGMGGQGGGQGGGQSSYQGGGQGQGQSQR